MRRAAALLLLAVLLGGLGASSAHRAQHAAAWAAAERTHVAGHPDGTGDLATVPCLHNDAHALDCAVCSGLGDAIVENETYVGVTAGAERQTAAAEAYVAFRRAAAPARGPPAVA